MLKLSLASAESRMLRKTSCLKGEETGRTLKRLLRMANERRGPLLYDGGLERFLRRIGTISVRFREKVKM